MPDPTPAAASAAAPHGPFSANGRPSPWLRHAVPEMFPVSEEFVLNDVVAVQLEEILVRQTKTLLDAGRADRDGARADAANLIMAEAIGIQRRHSPKGQRAMVMALLEGDPALAPLRADIADAIRRERRRARRAVLLAAAAAIASALLAAASFALPG